MQSVFCPACSAPLLSSATYCSTCGAAIAGISTADALTMPVPPPVPVEAPAMPTNQASPDPYAAQYSQDSGGSSLYDQYTPTVPSGSFASVPTYSSPSLQPTVVSSPQLSVAPPPPVTPPIGKTKTSGFAIASLTLGIIGVIPAILQLIIEGGAALDKQDSPSTDLVILLIVLIILCIPAIIAVIFGHLARRNISRGGGQVKGAGLSITGLILGYLSIGLPVAGLVLFAVARF